MIYLGLSGQPGLHPDFFTHALRLRQRYPDARWPIGMFGHDAAAAVVKDGRLVSAIEEERLSRRKHTMGIPRLAIEACARLAGENPRGMRPAYYANLDEYHLQRRQQAFETIFDARTLAAMHEEYEAARVSLGEVERELPGTRYIDHHMAHAASAFYPSGFDNALILVVDGGSESTSTSVFLGDAEGIRAIEHLPLGSSLGVLYGMTTAFLGFEMLEDEYKVMGLAAYANVDEHRAFFDSLFTWHGETRFSMPTLLKKAGDSDLFPASFGAPRKKDEPLEARHQVIAFSLQKAVERVVLRLLEGHARKWRTRNLCIAGGVGLNCALNGVIDRTGMFDRIFVQPAAGDAGAALGAALAAYHEDNPGAPRERMPSVYLGPSYGEAEVRAALQEFEAELEWARPRNPARAVAEHLAAGKIVAWFQGRMEYGPRALGNRSILANPTRADMKDHVNRVVKKREEFRPFAPAVLAEYADEYFVLRSHEQYEHMTVAVRTRPERAERIPAVVHVDGTARVQLVRKVVNPSYWEMIDQFRAVSGVPVVLNTSFNVKGEPIVCTPRDAVRCFLGTGIDHLAIEGLLVTKKPRGAVRAPELTSRPVSPPADGGDAPTLLPPPNWVHKTAPGEAGLRRWKYKGMEVLFEPDLDGAGTFLAEPFHAFIRKHYWNGRPFRRLFEWCAGPGFLAFSALAEGLCESICVADINPRAIRVVNQTVAHNGLADRVSSYVSDNFAAIPPSERFDVVVSNPPNFFALNGAHPLARAYSEDLRPNDPHWRIHEAFYANVAAYLNPGALLFVSEVEPNLAELYIPRTERRVPFDVRPRPPVDDFKRMIEAAGLSYLGCTRYVTVGDTELCMMVARRP